MTKTMSPEDHLRARIESQRLEIERLRGLKPELPPRAPDGEGLPRYGLRWNGPHEPVTVPMDDGFWTPWHLAAKAPAHEPGVVYRKWPGEPPHCSSCDCGMTDEQKRTVPFEDYQTFHTALMAIVHESKSFTEAVRLASDALQRKTAEPASRESPADLVGALQDVVHTDPGPVRAGQAVREVRMECLYCPARFMTAWELEVHEKEHALKSGVGRDAEARWLLNHSITRETRHEWTNRRDAWLGRPLTYPDHESAGAQFCVHCGESHAAPPCEDPIKSSAGETFPRVTVASIPIVMMEGSEQPPGELTFSNSRGDIVKVIGLGAKSGEQP